MATTPALKTRGQIIAALPVAFRASAEALFRRNCITPGGKNSAGEPLFSENLVRVASETTVAERRAEREGRHRVAAIIPGRTRSATGQVAGQGIQFNAN